MFNDAHMAALKGIVGADRVSAGESVRNLHSRDQSPHAAHPPDVVVWPERTEEVSRITAYANEHRIPITGWGAGSSLEGNSIPVKGGIVIDFDRMNHILSIYAEDFQVTVQPGIFYKDMNKTLGQHGLFFAPDPGANASIGGMIANNAAGTRTPKYGATRDNVLALEVVLANGDIIRTGSRSVKQSAGYDLTRLFVGSEGTLGLITEATLKLAPLPEHFSAAVTSFPTTDAAAQAVFNIMGAGLNPAALELLDAATTAALNDAGQLDLPVAPTLLLEFHGASGASLEVEMELVREICEESKCQTFTPGLGREARDRLWEARHCLCELLFLSYPLYCYLITDVAVPISQYPAIVAEASEALRLLDGVHGFVFGHAGDGNMHTLVVFPNIASESERVQREFNDRVVRKAIALGGTCTGEHGVGIRKQKYMRLEHGEAAMSVMRRLKEFFDPHGILNPGKVVS